MKKYIIFSFAALLGIASCSLKEDVLSYSTTETYYKTVPECIAGLNGCYNPLRTIYNDWQYFVVCECQSDLMVINRSDQPNGILNVKPSSPQFGTTMWNYGYRGVMRSNAVYAAILRSPLSAKEKSPLLAEAAVLRAFFYYILTSNFGDVPFYEEEVTYENNSRICQLPRMSASVTRNTLIDELHYWLLEVKALDMVRTYGLDNSRQYRCGAAVGLMLAGKMCLWEERWNDAIEFFGALESIYGPLSDYRIEDIPFGVKYNMENIFETTNIAEDYGLHVTGSLAIVCTPARTTSTSEEEEEEEDVEAMLENADYYKGIGIPEMGSQQRTRDAIRPTQRFFQTLMPQNSSDRRRARYDANGEEIEDGGGYLAWGWVGYSKSDDRSVTAPAYRKFTYTKVGGMSNVPYLGNKFWCFGMQYDKDSNNYTIFRYAGAVLGLAEAYFRKGDSQKACQYLNQVKKRAGIATVEPSDFSTGEELLKEIQNEYGRELFGEFQRKHDLVRWGLWYKYCVSYNCNPIASGGMNNTRMASHIQPCHEYYPIPDQQITYSNGALDNKEYNKYGL